MYSHFSATSLLSAAKEASRDPASMEAIIKREHRALLEKRWSDSLYQNLVDRLATELFVRCVKNDLLREAEIGYTVGYTTPDCYVKEILSSLEELYPEYADRLPALYYGGDGKCLELLLRKFRSNGYDVSFYEEFPVCLEISWDHEEPSA